MKKIRKYFVILVSVLMIATVLPISPTTVSAESNSGACGGNLTWTFNDGILNISGIGDMDIFFKEGNIPWRSFSDNINSVIISDGVTSICPDAFFNCYYLNSVTLPESVTKIAQGAFYRCETLSSIEIPDSVTVIENGAFSFCRNLASVELGSGLLSIGSGAFRDCEKISSIEIPESVISIGENAFNGTAYYKNADNYENGSLYNNKHLLSVSNKVAGAYTVKSGTKCIATKAFYYCTDITSVTIPESVVNIGDGAFSGCSGLLSIEIPGSVENICKDTFFNCRSLTSVKMNEGVKSIGNYVFYNCVKLDSVVIPDSVTSFGTGVFESTGLLNNVDKWENSVLYISNHLISVNDSLTGAYTVKPGTKWIHEYAFSGCNGITSITIPKSVVNINKYAFYDFSNSLESINVESGNTKYQSSGNCLIDTDSKTMILGCKNSVIPNDGSVESIKDYVFYQCNSLTSITIPDGVKSIGDNAFSFCANLTAVSIAGSVKEIGIRAFYGCIKLTSLNILFGVEAIGSEAFGACTNLTSLVMPESIKSIGIEAFWGCEGLSLTVPNGIINIEDRALGNCWRIIVNYGSYAHKYLLDNGRNYVLSEYMKCDINLDGEVDYLDYLATCDPTTVYPASCDFDGDNIIREFDKIILKRIFNGISFENIADVSSDGKTDLVDLIKLKKIASGLAESQFSDLNEDGRTNSTEISFLGKFLLIYN